MAAFRVVLHAHSNWSYDGSWSVADIARRAESLGVHLLMMTEHSQRFDAGRMNEYIAECDAASTNRIRVLPGIEYSTKKNRIHILTWGVNRYLGEEVTVDDVLNSLDHDNGLAIFAHPERRDVWREFERHWAAKLYGMEIWNRKTDGLAPSRIALQMVRDFDIKPVVAVDFHRKNQIYPLYNLLETEEDIFTLSNRKLIELIGGKTLKPRFLGLPVDDSGRWVAAMTRSFCEGLNVILRIKRRFHPG